MILHINVASKEVAAIDPVDLSMEGIWERRDLQEWILSNPSVLGEDLFVLDSEFDQFKGSSDRLDILCIDSSGAPVVVELKRDRHAGHSDLQAIRYAAKIKNLDLTAAARIYMEAQRRNSRLCEKEGAITLHEAINAILRFIDQEGNLDAELLSEPRIILASPGFSIDVSTTVLFLRDHGIDISCIELRVYRTDADHLALVPDRLIPLPEVDEYLAKLEVREARQEQVKRRRRGEAFAYCMAGKLIKDGDTVYLKHSLPTWVTFDPNDDRFIATVVGRGSRRPYLRWAKDGNEYSASNLASSIFQELRTDGGKGGSVAGPMAWGTENASIADLARAHQAGVSEELLTESVIPE